MKFPFQVGDFLGSMLVSGGVLYPRIIELVIFFCDFTQPGLCQKVAFWFREILGYFRKYPAG